MTIDSALHTVLLCDFCKSPNLQRVYAVPDSALGVIIAVCQECGLVQSIAAEDRHGTRVRSTSSGATWGNIRHGKGLRLQATVPVLENSIPWDRIHCVLDVGSNRGDFIRWLTANKAVSEVVGVEPDQAIVDGYEDIANVSLYEGRLEALNLPLQHFDFVYCSHTLEHANSAAQMLDDITQYLKVGGYLFLEVPNIDVLAAQDALEEFFIDKHRFHFNRSLLCDFMKQSGYRIVAGADSQDRYNITLVLEKEADRRTQALLPTENDLSSRNTAAIDSYQVTLGRNRKKLSKLVQEQIHPLMARQKVAFWGAGRVFDALVRYGVLRTADIFCLVDGFLWKILSESHGVQIRRPEYLKIAQPNLVFILARSSAGEIAAQAKSMGIRNTVKIADLLEPP